LVISDLFIWIWVLDVSVRLSDFHFSSVIDETVLYMEWFTTTYA